MKRKQYKFWCYNKRLSFSYIHAVSRDKDVRICSFACKPRHFRTTISESWFPTVATMEHHHTIIEERNGNDCIEKRNSALKSPKLTKLVMKAKRLKFKF